MSSCDIYVTNTRIYRTVCAIQRTIGKGEDNAGDVILKAFPIAGELADYGGKSLDPEIARLAPADLPGGEEDERNAGGGLRIILKGGFDDRPEHGTKRDQKAILNFICDPDRDGTEGEFDPEDKYDDGDDPLRARRAHGQLHSRDDEGEGDGDEGDGDDEKKPAGEIQLGDGKNASLVFDSWGPSDESPNVDVLRLTWRTKFACEGRADEGGNGSSDSHWGFFTWLVIL